MEHSLPELQQSIYGENGPPMFLHSVATARSRTRITKRRRLNTPSETFKLPPIKPVNELKGAETLVACQLPDGFPPEFAYRALAAYALLRTLSRELRLSPFTPNVFLRALHLPYPSRLLGQIHVNLLRILLPRLNMGYGYRLQGGSLGVVKKRRLDGIRWPLLGGDNLTYLDNFTWPLFYDDYCHLTADVLWVSMNDSNLYVDLRQIGEPTENSDDELEKDNDNDNCDAESPNDLREAIQVSKTNGESEDIPITEPIQDSDDDYQGDEEDEAPGGDNDDEYEASKYQSAKAKRARSRRTPLPPKRYPSRHASKKGLLAAPPKEPPPSASFYADHSSTTSYSSHMATPNSVTQSNVTIDRACTVPPARKVLVSELEVVSGSPLSQAVIFGSARSAASVSYRDGEHRFMSTSAPHAVARLNFLTSDGRNHTDKRLASATQGDLSISTPGVTFDSIREIPPVPFFAVSDQQSDKLDTQLQSRQYSPLVDSSQPLTKALTNKKTPGRSLPLNRGRNHAAGSLKASPAQNVSSHGPISMDAGFAQSGFSFGVEHSLVTIEPWQHPSRSVLQSHGLLQRSSSRTDKYSGNTGIQGDINHFPSWVEKTESKNSLFEVSAEVANELESTLMGTQSTPVGDIDGTAAGSELIDDASAGSDTVLGSQNGDDDILKGWPHFKAIKRMRGGDPYHRLPLEDKLDMLEFLVDELLTIDFIAAEFAKRDVLNGHPFPYGCLPSKSELDSLENEDECGVCGREGDLLCCDECTSSYHTICLGINQANIIPEGKWVCPECRITDPSKFGPLRGGKKSGVDWFTLDDLLAAEKLKGQPFAPRFDTALEAMDYSRSETSRFEADAETFSALGGEISGSPVSAGEMEFLVVGSFVFTRPRCTIQMHKLRSIQPASILPLTKDSLAQCFLKIGPEMSLMWPFAQVPLDPTEIWMREMPLASYIPSTLYFTTLDSHDPSFYWSQYRKAPLPKSMKAGAGAQSSTLSEIENEFVAVNTNRLSEVLSRDMQFDGEISRVLKTSTALFDPYHVVASVMIRLEASLRKAALLHESWGTRNIDFKTDVWANNVRKSKSLPRLIWLLVKLIDAVNPRAFVDEWHKVPGSNKNPDRENPASSLNTRRLALPQHWTAEAELRKRKWERCPIWGMRALLAQSSSNESISHQPRGRKRKHGVVPVKIDQSTLVLMKHTGLTEDAVEDQQLPIDDDPLLGSFFDPMSNVELPTDYHQSGEVTKNDDSTPSKDGTTENANRRRSDRVQTRSGACVGIESVVAMGAEDTPLSEMELAIEKERKRKLLELEKTTKASSPREVNWPLAGRRLFEPAGYLPPQEVRRLGRKAGAAAAQFVTYSASHEVGQTVLSHRWRKRTLACKSYEEMLLRIKSLESFIDSSTIAAGDALARRTSKKQNQSSIACSHRDLQTGIMEYFVLDRDRKRGCWVTLENMELAPLMLDLFNRMESQCKKLEYKKKQKMEQQKKAILALSVQSANAVVPVDTVTVASSAPVGRQLDNPRSNGRPAKRPKREIPVDRIQSASPLETHIQMWNKEVEAALLEHQLETRQLVLERTKHGLSLLPPEAQMNQLRLQRIRRLKTPLESLRRCGDSKALEAEIVARLTQAEIDALKTLGGNQLVNGSSVTSLPATLDTFPHVQSLSSNYRPGVELDQVASNRTSYSPLSHDSNGRSSLMEPVSSAPAVSAFPQMQNALPHYQTDIEFDAIGRSTGRLPVLNHTSPMLPYVQARIQNFPPTTVPYNQNMSLPFQTVPMNVARDTWSHTNMTQEGHGIAHPAFGSGGTAPYSNAGLPQGMFDGYSQFRNNGFASSHQYSQLPRQTSSGDTYFSQQGAVLSSFMPSYQLNSAGSMPSGPQQPSFRVAENNASAYSAQRPASQTFPSQQVDLGLDLEPRPIEEMSQNSQDLELLLRRFGHYQR